MASKVAGSKVSATVPAEAALAMNVGQLALALDAKCTPTDAKPASTVSYRSSEFHPPANFRLLQSCQENKGFTHCLLKN